MLSAKSALHIMLLGEHLVLLSRADELLSRAGHRCEIFIHAGYAIAILESPEATFDCFVFAGFSADRPDEKLTLCNIRSLHPDIPMICLFTKAPAPYGSAFFAVLNIHCVLATEDLTRALLRVVGTAALQARAPDEAL